MKSKLIPKASSVKGIEVNQKAMEVKCTHTGDNKVSETKSWGSDKTNEAEKLLSRKKEN